MATTLDDVERRVRTLLWLTGLLLALTGLLFVGVFTVWERVP